LFGIGFIQDEERFNLAYDEEIININTGTIQNLSSIADSSKRILVQNLTPGNYRYRVRTRLNYWDLPINNEKLNLRPRRLGIRPIVGFTWRDYFSFNEYASLGGLDNTSDRIKEFYYEFSVTETPVNEEFNITLADVLIKALNSVKVRKLNDSRYYRKLSGLSEFNSLIKSKVISTTYFEDNPTAVVGPANSHEYKTGIILSPVNQPTVYYYVDSGIVNNQVNIEGYDTSFDSVVYYTKPLDFKYDQTILEKATQITSLDFTFAGGRNLLEVLFELGKGIGGIPRIYFDTNLNPIISFDILEDLINNPEFVDEAALTKKIASTSSYATNVISEVKNFVTQDDIGAKATNTVVYPSKSSWVTPRAIDFNSALMRPDTMSVAIDDPNHGIFKVINIKVTNFDNANTELDITDYIHERTIFETFPNAIPNDWATTGNKEFKGLALYYERGGNQILNLNEITDEDNVFRLSGTKFTIRRIIENAMRNLPTPQVPNFTKPEVVYQYRIEYIPLVKSARLFIEQSNVTQEKQSINMPYNQTERNVSLSQFFQAADNALKRNGIPSISKNYIFKSIDEVPFIGEKIDFDGYDYFADKINISYDNNTVICDVQFSRDVNKIDPIVGFNKEYREYSLASDNVLWKRMNINNYAFITGDNIYTGINEFSPSKTIFPDSVINVINGTGSIEKIEGAVFNFYNKNAELVNWNNGFEKVKPIGVSVVSAVAGNSLIFATSMYDNFAAGRKMERILWNNGQNAIAGLDLIAQDQAPFQDFERNRLSQKYVRYVDDDGNANVARVLFLKKSDTATFDPLSVPEIEDTFEDVQYRNYISKAVMDETFFLDKDNREALQLAFQLHFVSKDKNIDVRPAFAKYNKLITLTSELPVPTGNPIVVGVKDLDSLKNRKTYDYDTNDILLSSIGVGYVNPNDKSIVGMIPTNAVSNKNTNYEGYAVVFPGTKEILILRKRDISLGTPIGSIYIAFSEEVL
jgi:hypothetical protein